MSLGSRERSLDDMLRELGIDISTSQLEDNLQDIESMREIEHEVAAESETRVEERRDKPARRVDDIISLIELSMRVLGENSEIVKIMLVSLKDHVVSYVKEHCGETTAKLLDIALRALSRYERR